MPSVILLVFLGFIGPIIPQETARAVLAPHLRECYNDPTLLNRNNLPPMTLPVLLDIIRKIEDYPGTVANMRQLSMGIIHMFRQDGIVFDPESEGTRNVLSYSPTGFQAYKNRLLLTKLMPNNQFRFPNDSLTPSEKCTLHHMVSSTIAMQTRGDESIVCSLISQAPTVARKRRSDHPKMNPDVEVFDVNAGIDPLGRQIIGTSTCPLEGGVISSPWSAIAVGPLISGIASALEPQQVLVSDLVQVKDDFVIDETTRVNNVFASTLAGDLAESAMRQGTSRGSISIGSAGGWNNTNISSRRHYFLRQADNMEMTDAEIRGGIDGLILGDLGSSYVNDFFPELKLSQIIEMYYSEKGTLHDSRFRACLRKSLITAIAPTATLQKETFAFAVALYTTMPLAGTLALTGVETFVNATVDSLYQYVAQSFNDPECSLTNTETIRPRINLMIVTDPSLVRYPLVSYILDGIDVGKFGSSIMLADLQGNTVIDKTFSISHFHQEYAKISTMTSGGALNLTSVLRSIRSMAAANLALETATHVVGGNASVVLVLAENIPLTSDELREANLLAELMRQQAPDLRLIFGTSSASEDSLQFVIKERADFISLTLSNISPAAIELAPVVARLLVMPRRIINPLCSTHWLDLNSGTVSFDDYVDADGTNLYSIHPNYFYRDNQARVIRVQAVNYGSVNVCYSRSDSFPRRNRTSSTTPPDVTCESVTGSSSLDISLAGACEGYSTIAECPPLYITVTAAAAASSLPQCRDAGCRLPNDIKYSMVAQQLGCYSSTARLLADHVTLSILYTFVFLKSLQ